MQKQIINALKAKKIGEISYDTFIQNAIAEAKVCDDLPWIQGKYIKPETLPILHEERWLIDASLFTAQLTTDDTKNVFVSYNGSPVLMQSYDPGIIITTIEEGLKTFGKKILTMQEGIAIPSMDKISLLTKNLFHNGAFIYIPDNTTQKVVRIYIYNSIGEGDIVDSMRNIIIVGKHNHVEIIAEDLPIAGDSLSIASVYEDVYVDESSSLSYIRLATHAQNIYTHTTKVLYGAKDSDIKYIDILLGSAYTTQNISMRLTGEGSRSHLYGIAVPNGEQIIENYVTIYNEGQNTEGKVLYKNVVDGKAALHFDGMIKVLPDADGTNSYLEDHTILLSSDAKSESVPGLEIEANEVKASHGATVGSIDPEELFYVESRGIPEKEAKQLIISGFLATILTYVFDDSIKDRILTYITTKLHG